MNASNNAYFSMSDASIREINGKPLPSDWWSRPYEYAFALEHVDKNAVVADMGCGWMGRPLTAELARQCKEVYAIDADDRVSDLDREDHGLYYLVMDFTSSEMDYFKDGIFNTVFCISVLEDLSPDDRLNALKNFRRLLAKGGKIVVTMDCIWEPFRIAKPYPTVNLNHFMKEVEKAGLVFVGDVSVDMPENAVHQSIWNLSCYHCLLESA